MLLLYNFYVYSVYIQYMRVYSASNFYENMNAVLLLTNKTLN